MCVLGVGGEADAGEAELPLDDLCSVGDAEKIIYFPKVADRRTQCTGFGKPVYNCALVRDQRLTALLPKSYSFSIADKDCCASAIAQLLEQFDYIS